MGVLIAAVVAACTGTVHSAGIVPACATPPEPRSRVVTVLSAKFGEQQRDWRVLTSSTVAELWQNPRTSSWTIVISTTSGVSCIYRAGLGLDGEIRYSI